MNHALSDDRPLVPWKVHFAPDRNARRGSEGPCSEAMNGIENAKARTDSRGS